MTHMVLKLLALFVLVSDSHAGSAPCADGPSEVEMLATIQAYLAAITASNRTAYLAVFAQDALLQDPVGSRKHRGLEKIGQFFDELVNIADSNTLELWDKPRFVPCEAIFQFRSILVNGTERQQICPIDHVVFNQKAQFTLLRGFWRDANFITLPNGTPPLNCTIQ
eukprot:TRINITY_DN84175_c0_g1_i1.p2 TRINITY_DN84175_c0_g1~~TRINITY_DN84175_c0_g1_i1.p2  ORF type:complete len:166 (+),score=26.89 TRINITY_DN84175_c0_g1_i1:68-565(+)